MLKTFSKLETVEFRKFINSPFFNESSNLVKLYDTIRKFHPYFSSPDFNKKFIFESLYKGKKYNDKILRNGFSGLFRLIKLYLAYNEFEQDTFTHRTSLLKSLDKRNLDSLFEREYLLTKVFIDGKMIHNKYFLNNKKLEESKILFHSKRMRQERSCENMIRFSDYSVIDSIVELFSSYNNLWANKHSFNYNFNNSVTELFLLNFNFENFFKNFSYDNINYYNYIIYWYYAFLCRFYPDKEEYYQLLKDYSFKNFDNLEKYDQYTRYRFLYGYCQSHMDTNSKYLKECYDLRKEALEKGLHNWSSDDDNRMNFAFYGNFVREGLACKDFDFVEKFINEYGNKLYDSLEGNTKEDTIAVSSAMLLFERKEFYKAIELLRKVKVRFHFSKFQVKYLYLKIFYETNNWESFFPMLDTFKHYLKNEKRVPDYIIKSWKSLLKYVNQMGKIKMSQNYSELYELKNELSKNPQVGTIIKLWLLEKINEMENSKL